MKKATSSEEQRRQAHGDITTDKRKVAITRKASGNAEESRITLAQCKGEPRVDSRLLTKQLGTQHKNTMELIERYADKIKRFGLLPFQTEAVKVPGSRGVKHQHFALLNEDQAFFLLALSRNSDTVVELKANLITAFREARAHTSVTDTQYLPMYHAMHEEVKLLATRALECGSTTPERMFHINANKALIAAMGMACTERETMTIEQRLLLTTLQSIYGRTLRSSLDAGTDHREAASRAKDAVRAYMVGAGDLLLGSDAA